jgi:hypothetical protein
MRLKSPKIGLVLVILMWPASGQQAPLATPAWLVPYPGAQAKTTAASAPTVEAVYTAAATAQEVVEHYGRLFDAAGVPFSPNFDGIGTSIRGAAAECDLLIKIQEDSGETLARVSCTAKTAAPLGGAEVSVTNSSPTNRNRSSSGRVSSRPNGAPAQESARAAEWRAALQKRIADSNAANERRRANIAAGRYGEQAWPHAPENDAPPLVWPDWLVSMEGGRVNPKQGVDQSYKNYLQSGFISSAPMTEIYNFYKDLLKAHGFSVYSARLGTGQTLSGIVQNAVGHVEGSHHPYDITGPRTVIRVDFRRNELNAPISVSMRVTVYPRF